MASVDLLVVGAGQRGSTYARYVGMHPQDARIVGVAEPQGHLRAALAADHGLAPEQQFHDWRDLAALPRQANGVIIATQDSQHIEPALAFAAKGYHILLEKPMAPTPLECIQIADAAERNSIILTVCHVLRYTRYTQLLKQVIDSGRIGEVVAMQHLEPLGFWHQAHSFVRGNWRNERLSSPMLLAKSCHDIDWIRYIMGRPCTQVSSFGSLRHFRPEMRPAGAADRCLDCSIEPECPYSAPRLYFDLLEAGRTGWPVSVLTSDTTVAGVTTALREGPYGRCVYACDNDVVDHQSVIMQFADGATADFTMTGLSRDRNRETHIFGSHGEIYGDGESIEIYDFRSRSRDRIDTKIASDGSILTGHGGGDNGVMEHFVAALAASDPARVLSGPAETLESHLIVFAAEESRRTGQTIALNDFRNGFRSTRNR